MIVCIHTIFIPYSYHVHKQLKQIADRLTLSGTRGQYFLDKVGISDEFVELFSSLLRSLEAMQAKVWDKGEAATQVQKELTTTMARLEILLPIYWNTQVLLSLSLSLSFFEQLTRYHINLGNLYNYYRCCV